MGVSIQSDSEKNLIQAIRIDLPNLSNAIRQKVRLDLKRRYNILAYLTYFWIINHLGPESSYPLHDWADE